MKKWIIFLICCIVVAAPAVIWATPPGFSGGVNNEYEYEEVVFISGEPIKFVGTYTLSERERDNEKTVTYKFSKLMPEDKTIDATMTKTITYETLYTHRNDKGQTIGQTTVKKYSEKIKIGEDTYDLEDYQFSKSDVIDNRPASDFHSGNIKGRKYYSINRDEGKVVVEISGGNVGYKNFWGSTETQIIDYYISYQRDVVIDEEEGDMETLSWNGTVSVQASDSQTKTLKYSDNEANFSSFNGGHIRITNSEMVSKYEYNLPKITDGEIDEDRRNRGTIYLSKKMVPKLERLIVPKFRDVKGHWAEEYIEKLYSLDVFDDNAQFFSPDIPATRAEFTKGVIRACNIRTSLGEEKRPRSRRNAPVETSPFEDVKTEDPDYQYIKDAVEKKIIAGVTPKLFQPNEPLTRAQAITILVRALGFENRGPNPGYYTSFADDDKIPNWAKDSIYVAREINLIQGDTYNRVNPDKVMTRAEASTMLVRFLEFLEKDLQRDYRENIIHFH